MYEGRMVTYKYLKAKKLCVDCRNQDKRTLRGLSRCAKCAERQKRYNLRYMREREDEMREYYLAELERIKHEREKDNDLLGRDSNGDPAAPEAMRVRMGQQLPEGPGGCTTDCPEGRGD